jgi:hypothetical protein
MPSGLLWLSLLAAGLSGCSDSVAPPAVTVVAVAGTDGQSARIGTPLPTPLSVRVESDGAPKAGVAVTWQAAAGSIAPASGVTNDAGLASATWTLGDAPGPMTASTTVGGAQGSPVTFTATATPPTATATVVPASDGQTAVVGTALPLPLRVQVNLDGDPQAGVTIHWHALQGVVAPVESVTDGDGVASATWTLGTSAGHATAEATLAGPPASRATFSATGLPGPVAAIEAVGGDGQTSPANRPQFSSMVVVVSDQYRNAISGQAVSWTVQSGPVVFSMKEGTTDAIGRSAAIVEPTGTTGDVVVRVTPTGSAASASFALTVLPPVYRVVLDNYVFRSDRNGSRTPAVDTIPVGATMEWLLEPFDYDLHRIVSVGLPSFPDAEIPYASPALVSRTFVTAGTYEYADFYYPDDRGTVVVR